MSKIKSDNSDITIDASGSGRDIKFQANGVEKASISSAGAFTSTTIDATKLTGTIPNFTSTGIDDNADATAITISSAENVGIGTASVSFPSGTGLEVYDSSIPRIKLANSTTGNASTDGFDIHISGSDVKFWQRENAAMSFATNGTERMQITSDGRGLSQFTAKAWINFNGQISTPSIYDSHNVSSITDNAAAQYTINFSNNMANDDYCAVAHAHAGGGTNDVNVVQMPASGRAVGSVGCHVMSALNTATTFGNGTDSEVTDILIFGD